MNKSVKTILEKENNIIDPDFHAQSIIGVEFRKSLISIGFDYKKSDTFSNSINEEIVIEYDGKNKITLLKGEKELRTYSLNKENHF